MSQTTRKMGDHQRAQVRFHDFLFTLHGIAFAIELKLEIAVYIALSLTTIWILFELTDDTIQFLLSDFWKKVEKIEAKQAKIN